MGQLFKANVNTYARGSVLALGLAPVVLFYAGSTLSRSPLNTKARVALSQPVPFSHKHHNGELGIDCRFCHPNVEKSATAGIPPVETCMTCHSQIWTNSPLLAPVRDAYENGTTLKFSDSDQVGWNQVNKVPEFVYFNHSIHINRGVNCNNCHGPVQEMALTYKNQAFAMAFCLECHKNPEKYLFEDPKKPDQKPSDHAFEIYRKLQNEEELTPRERHLAAGDPYEPTQEETEAGKALMEQYKIKQKQLTDCWVCHR